MTGVGQVRVGDRKAWLNTALTSTALAAGCCLFIGHSMMRRYLAGWFGYSASPFSVLSYNEILMRGVDAIFQIIAEHFVCSAVIASLLHWKLAASTRRMIATGLALMLSALAAVTTTLAGTLVGPSVLNFLAAHWHVTLVAILLAILIATVEYLSDNFFFRGKERLGFLLMAGWVYVLWLSAGLISPGYSAFPRATLTFKDGRAEQYSFIAQRDQVVVLGDGRNRRTLFVPLSEVAVLRVGNSKVSVEPPCNAGGNDGHSTSSAPPSGYAASPQR